VKLWGLGGECLGRQKVRENHRKCFSFFLVLNFEGIVVWRMDYGVLSLGSRDEQKNALWPVGAWAPGRWAALFFFSFFFLFFFINTLLLKNMVFKKIGVINCVVGDTVSHCFLDFSKKT
jgi:hypothetical protein